MFSSERNSGAEFLKTQKFNGSDFFQNNQNDQQGPVLARYRSAPSSYLAALLDSNTDNNNNNNNSSSGDESDAFFAALIDGPIDLNQTNNSDDHPAQYSMKQEIVAETEPRTGGTGGYVGSYYVGMENQVHVSFSNNGNGNRSCSNLVRQNSSPVGGFNGFGVMGDVGGDYRVHNQTETSSSAGGFITSHLSFSSGPSSSSRFLPTIPENVNEDIPKNTRSGNGKNSSWDEPPLKRNRDGDLKMFSGFNGLENQSGENRKTSTGLVSHMNLPRTSNEMVDSENYLHFQQETTTTSVPCQIRAKRGFATHPRSIAERMRRTRISDNMKKLHDLFPNMDKQTNTAEMLDMAVDYIKDLQKQVQTLTDTKTKCVCSNKPQQTSPTT